MGRQVSLSPYLKVYYIHYKDYMMLFKENSVKPFQRYRKIPKISLQTRNAKNSPINRPSKYNTRGLFTRKLPSNSN